MRLYNRFFQESKQVFGSAATQIPQSWIVGDVNHCVAELVTFIKTYGITDIVTWGVPPGIRPQDMTASLAAFATQVVPRVRSAIGAET
jgi:hypothetical protein